jgi:hypothetical protein
MSTLQHALIVLLAVLLTWRVAAWWSKRHLDQAIAKVIAQGGLHPSEEFMALLRRPTVDGVARRVLKKMGLANWADVLVLGMPVTLVCHDRAHLQQLCDAIKALQPELEEQMRLASAEQTMAALDRKFKKPAGETAKDTKPREGEHGIDPSPNGCPTIPNPPAPPAFRVIEGGAK